MTSLSKILRVLVAQWIERTPGVRKGVGSIRAMAIFSEYYWFEKKKTEAC